MSEKEREIAWKGFCLGVQEMLELYIKIKKKDIEMLNKTSIFFLALGGVLGVLSGFKALADPFGVAGSFFAVGMLIGSAIMERIHIFLTKIELDYFRDMKTRLMREPKEVGG